MPAATWRRRALCCAAALLLAPAMAVQAGEAPTVESVLQCMRANVPQTLQIKEVELTATDRNGGSRRLRGRLYARRESDLLQAMMRIESPSDLAGAAYLLRQREGTAKDEMYVYLPSMAKVRRINGAAVDGSLWGTDLSYGDIRQITGAFANTNARLEKTDTLAQRSVYVLTLQPEAETQAGSQITQLHAWVDAKSCIALRVDFSDGQTVRRRLDVAAGDLRQDGRYWYAGTAVMRDLQGGTQTTLKVLGVSADKDLVGRYFNPSTFYVGG